MNNSIAPCRKKKISDGKLPEYAVLFFSALLFAVVAYFHEPWFDEAQAWQIAKDASLKEILFTIPHYEGHPPLWHLILLIPAKLGAPYELSLKLISGCITMAVIAVILFKSTFPRIVKLLLPFNYWIFYQYGIICRPYNLLVLAFLLTAITFKNKDGHPFRFLAALAFMCLCSAYGILIAGGICLCWVIDILKGTKPFRIGTLIKDRRVAGLFCILAFAILLLLEIWPVSDAYANNLTPDTSIFFRLAYCFLALLPDTMITAVLQSDEFIQEATLVPVTSVIIASSIGAVLLLLIFGVSGKDKFKYFIIPYCLFAAISALKYCCAHHIGVIFALLLFWLWTNLEDSSFLFRIKPVLDKNRKDFEKASVKYPVAAILLSFLIVPAVWSAAASYNDIRYAYYDSRETAEFIQENIPEDALIMASWNEGINRDADDLYERMSSNSTGFAVVILPYFDDNIFMNLNNGDKNLGYATHIISTAEENRENLALWKQMGIPDVLVGDASTGNPDIEAVYGDEISLADYAPVYKIDPTNISIWKGFYSGGEGSLTFNYIYVRRDLLEEYGLTEIEADPYLYPY